MSGPVVELKIIVPKKLYDKLEELEKKYSISKEDIVLRALVKVLEEMG